MRCKYWILMGWVVSILLITTGCATVYRSPGAEKSPISELAVLSVTQRNVSIRKVDGKLLVGGGTINRLELVPGTRSITTFLVSGYAQAAELTIEFEARAGEQYELKAKQNDERRRWEVWIVKKGTNPVISKASRGLI